MPVPWIAILLSCFLVCTFVQPLAAAAETKRVALVVGNSAYSEVPALQNSTRDAEAVASALRDVGFDVTVKKDLAYDEMRRTLRDFASLAAKSEWALVHFAGHGIETGGQNYVIPTDATLRFDSDVTFEAISLEQILGSINGAQKLRLVILDACRDNPFLPRMPGALQTRSVKRGLARVEPEGNTLVAYAAKAGEVAFDGEQEHSPFVQALTSRLRQPGVEIRRLFGQVRDDVRAATDGRQDPYLYGSLGGEEFFFAIPKTDPASSISVAMKPVDIPLDPQRVPDRKEIPVDPPAPPASPAERISIFRSGEDPLYRRYNIALSGVDIGDSRGLYTSIVVLTDYRKTGYRPKDLVLLRISISTSSLSERSRRGRFEVCGELAYQPGDVRLHYGTESGLNKCVLSKLSPEDRQLWQSIYKWLPKAIAEAASSGDEDAQRLATLFRQKPI